MTQAAMTAAALPSGEFRLGQILSKAWAQFLRRPGALALATLSGWFPLFVVSEIVDALSSAGDGDTEAEMVGLNLLLANYLPHGDATALAAMAALFFAAALTLPALSVAITTHLVLPGPLNSETSLRTAISRGISRLPSVVAMMFLAAIATLAGLVALVIPGLVMLAAWAAAVPACTYERLGPIRSLSRSAQLTKNFRWRVLALVMIFFAVNFSVAVARYGGTLYFGLAGFASGAVADFIVTIWFNVAIVEAYRELRVIKEGAEVEGVVEVFE